MSAETSVAVIGSKFDSSIREGTAAMPGTYLVEAIRSGGKGRPAEVIARLLIRSDDLEAVKQQTVQLFQTAHAPRWSRPFAEALRVMDASGVERFRCA